MAQGPVGIFETQLHSDWVQGLLREVETNFGHKEVTYRRRALLALDEAGIVGETMTTMQMENALLPFIGPAHDRPSRAAMVIIGVKNGIMVKGDMVKPEGHRRPLPAYHIIGHMEMQANGDMVPVMMEAA